MADPNTPSNVNGDQDVTNQSSNDDQQNSVASDQTNIARESSHRCSPSTSGAAQSSRLSTDHRRHVRLGQARPRPLDYTPGLDRGGLGNAYITCPSDEIERLFSSSIQICVYHPLPRESDAVGDTQPPDMPPPFIFNSTRHELMMHNGNNHVDVNARGYNNPGGSTDVVTHNEPTNRPTIGNNTMITVPVEHPHDTDFSVDTFDPHSDNRSDADSEEDEHRRAGGDVPIICHENNLTHTNEGQALPSPAVVSINPENTVGSNQTNLPVGPPCATGSSYPQAADNERSCDNPTGAVGQSRVHIIPPSNSLLPKIESPADSGDESSAESMQ